MPESSSMKRKRTEEDLRNAYNYSRSFLEANVFADVAIPTGSPSMGIFTYL